MMDGAPSARFGLALLGRFELSGPQGAIKLPGGKLAGLLAYLACTAPRPQSRERLSTLFWGSHFDAQAKQNLRQALARLRRVLGTNALQGDGEAVWLDASVVDCDVGRFEALIHDGGRDALSAAADLYRGALVDDVAVREEGFGEWLAAERERLLELALGALVGLGAQELAAGRAELALKAGRRAVQLNTMREDAHRLVVQALVAAGRRAEALRHYQDLSALLKRELDTEPDAATRALVAELDRADSQAAVVEAPSAASAPERRQLTIMVCQMALAARLDPEDSHDLTNAFQRRIAEVAARFDGVVARPLGDGASLYFGYPIAREHDTDQAVRAALAIQAAVGVRIGIATGLVVVGAEHPLAIGETPALAERLQALALPGEVMIAGSTRRLVGRRFDCRAAHSTNGLEAWQVLGETEGLSRFEARRVGALSPLVGRQEEMERLLRRWDQAKAGDGQVVLLSGEAGIGKSRIAESLLAAVGDGSPPPLRYFCSPYHANSPLHPITGQFERVLALEPGGATATKLDRLQALLAPVSKDVARDVALMAELLGVPLDARYPALAMTPQQKREATLAALIEQVGGTAAQGPLLIVAEDAHWIDPTSLDLLDRMVARASHLPVLLLVTGRPEFEPAWLGQPNVTTLSLSRLGRRDSVGIIAGVAGGKALPGAVVEQVLAQADGVPLFIEELTTTLLESGLLREAAERYVLDGALPSLAVPTTLQASLVERLDRLGAGRDVAVIGAAIGREFPHALIDAVTDGTVVDLEAALKRVTESGLVSRRGTPPDATYLFKHALVQDAAYGTLLRGRRRELHARIAQALVERFPATAESEPEIVAHHYTEAGLAGEAIGYWRKAGLLAAQRSANREAAGSFERALHLIAAEPETRELLELAIDIRFDLRAALFQLGGFERIAGYLREAEGFARTLGDQRRLGQLSVYLCHNRGVAGELEEAIGFGRTAQAIAEQLGDVPLQVTANLDLAVVYVYAADYRPAEAIFTRVLGSLAGEQRRERFGQTIFPVVAANGYLTWIFADQGRFDEAIAAGREAVRLAEALDHAYSLVFAVWALARAHVVKGEPAEAAALFERGVTVCTKWGLTFLGLLNSGGLGYAQALAGRTEEGIALLEQALAANEAIPAGAMLLPLSLIYLGEAYLLADRPHDARVPVERSLALGRRYGQRGWEVASLRLLGEIAQRRDPTGEQACPYYGDALTLAEQLGFRPLAAHCHASLARLHRSTGSIERAEQHLATATTMYHALGMTYWMERARV